MGHGYVHIVHTKFAALRARFGRIRLSDSRDELCGAFVWIGILVGEGDGGASEAEGSASVGWWLASCSPKTRTSLARSVVSMHCVEAGGKENSIRIVVEQ